MTPIEQEEVTDFILTQVIRTRSAYSNRYDQLRDIYAIVPCRAAYANKAPYPLTAPALWLKMASHMRNDDIASTAFSHQQHANPSACIIYTDQDYILLPLVLQKETEKLLQLAYDTGSFPSVTQPYRSTLLAAEQGASTIAASDYIPYVLIPAASRVGLKETRQQKANTPLH